MPLEALDYLLKAVKEVTKTHPVKLTVVGEPKKDSRDHQAQSRELDLGRQVTITRRIDNGVSSSAPPRHPWR